MPNNYDLHFSNSLVGVRYKAETRQGNGLLAPEPRLFVLSYSEEWDQWKVERIGWDTARTLAPTDVAKIGVMMRAARDTEDAAEKTAKREQERESLAAALIADLDHSKT
jgi:hypothetical protein